MEKIDARTFKDEALHERRRQVIRLHKRGGSPAQIAQVSELSYPTVRKIIRLYETGGTAGIKPGKRSRCAGENRSLSEEQERLLQRLICEKRPEQMKMDYALWNRAAVSQLIKQECHISCRSARWGVISSGFAPQKLIKKAYEQRPEAVKQWLDEQYPEIVWRARTEGEEAHWGDETALVNTDLRGVVLHQREKRRWPMHPGRGSVLSMIATVTNKGCARGQIIDGNFDSDRLIEFLDLLIKDAGRNVFLHSG